MCNKKSKGQKTTTKLMRRLQINITLNINEKGRDVVGIQVARSRDKWWALINTGRNQTLVSAKSRTILRRVANIMFSRNNLINL